MKSWMVVAALAACGTGTGSPASARYDRCDALAIHDDVVKAIVVQRCTGDGWQADAIDCFSVAASSSVLDGCRRKLTDEQGKKLEAELGPALASLTIGRLTEVKTQMCACKSGDTGCTARAKRAWDQVVDAPEPVRPSAAAGHVIADLALQTNKCEEHAKRESPMAAMNRFKDEICACGAGDQDCALRFQNEMTRYAEANKDMRDMKMSDAEMKEATDLGMAMAKCMATVMGAATP